MKCSIHFWRSPCVVQCGLPNLCEFLLSKGALCRHLFLASKRSWQFRWGRSERWWTFLLPFTNQVLPGLVIWNRLEQVLKKQSKNWGSAHSNQIYLSTRLCVSQLTRASFSQKIKCSETVFWYLYRWDGIVASKIMKFGCSKSIFYIKKCPNLSIYFSLKNTNLGTYFL